MSPEDAPHAMQVAKHDGLNVAVTVKGGLDTSIQATPSTAQHTNAISFTTAASKVFTVAELIELIAVQLPIPDVMSLQQVNRYTYGILTRSPRLQRHISLRPQRLPGFHIPLAGCFPKTFVCKEEGWDSGHYQAYFTPSACQRYPRIGPRYKRMMICQPPLHEAKVSVECIHGAFSEGGSHFVTLSDDLSKVVSETGLTVGDLHDHFKEASKSENRTCDALWAIKPDRIRVIFHIC